MPPRRRFDKKNAQTFQIVHRAHDDSRFYDEEASSHVLVSAPSNKNKVVPHNEVGGKKKIYTIAELEQKLDKDEISALRENEGLAAQYGIFFDDSKYDYMQHLKPIGQDRDAVFIQANSVKKNQLKAANVEELFKGQLPSDSKRKVTTELNQSIPDELKGFNPDMDPRLREVLEALEDEAYITDEEAEEDTVGGGEGEAKHAAKGGDDIFSQLLQSGEVENEEEFYGSDYDDFEDGYDEWDLDNYEDEYNDKYDSDNYEEAENLYNEGEAPVELADSDIKVPKTGWQSDFWKFKAASKNKVNEWDSDDEFDEGGQEEDALQDVEDDDIVGELPTSDTFKKTGTARSKTKMRKKKGAMTDTSSFSMSSSALFRTEGLTLLDDRYEQLAKKFEDEPEEKFEEFDMSKERNDFEDMLDDFLDNYELESGGRKVVRKDEEKKKLQEAADSVSKGKVAARRKKEKNITRSSLDNLGGSLAKLNI
ncbi:hypothetical protein G9P44_001308 [Scheffersomyces stipitis]|nr:hypothetical protein G9P44_001308 [Scheffersomyces stipitis]